MQSLQDKNMALMTDNEFQINVFGANELVQGLGVLDSGQNGWVNTSHAASVFFTG